MLINQNAFLTLIRFESARELTRIVVRCIWLAVLLGQFPTASADLILYEAGFEPPSYGLGSLAGQDNWGNTTPIPVVQTSDTFSGSQAVQFSATGLTGQTIINRPIVYNSTGNPDSVVKFTIQAKLSDSSSTSNWNIFSVTSNAGFLVQLLVVQNRNARIASAGASTGNVFIAPNIWNQYELDIDFGSQMASAFVNGQFIGQRQLSVTSATNINRVAFGVNSLPGSDTIFYDDLRIVSIPEPGSIALLLCGAMRLLLLRGNRKP